MYKSCFTSIWFEINALDIIMVERLDVRSANTSQDAQRW
jgi:hypothetical protein